MNWDIFCNVVDNYGDIGVSWRLARQLASEYGMHVRLWVDDLESFIRLCPEGAHVDSQRLKGVEVRRWVYPFPEAIPGEVVIESFGCTLPESFVWKMASMEKKPVWINLEYLSAEEWVEDCHLMPSPRPPLVKHFFFPGFTRKTGGLILERDLFERRREFRQGWEVSYWREKGIDPDGRMKISLFCYENSALETLLESWAVGDEAILCLVPEGRVSEAVKHFLGNGSNSKGNLEVGFIPFVEQEKYDLLLWACDINFVRGEDSFVRAQWAQKPFVWQIYPQEEGAHLQKLNAFLDKYCRTLSVPSADAVRRMWAAWNGMDNMGDAWAPFSNVRAELEVHGAAWAEEISGNNLASNLVDFVSGKR
jgi:uncharacterized repeat protein (TIGR03837 family)